MGSYPILGRNGGGGDIARGVAFDRDSRDGFTITARATAVRLGVVLSIAVAASCGNEPPNPNYFAFGLPGSEPSIVVASGSPTGPITLPFPVPQIAGSALADVVRVVVAPNGPDVARAVVWTVLRDRASGTPILVGAELSASRSLPSYPGTPVPVALATDSRLWQGGTETIISLQVPQFRFVVYGPIGILSTSRAVAVARAVSLAAGDAQFFPARIVSALALLEGNRVVVRPDAQLTG